MSRYISVSYTHLVTATLVLATLPIIILYIALQKYIVEGVVAGAVKG